MKVTLREKKIKYGRRSLYLDFYPPVTVDAARTRREFLSLYIFEKPKDELERAHNKETRILAQNVAAKRQLELQAGQHGFLTKNSRRSDFLDYFKKEMAKHDTTASTLNSWYCAFMYLSDYCNGSLQMQQLDRRFVEDYRKHLLNCRTRSSDKKNLARNTAAGLFQRFCSVVKKAYKDKLLPENPAEDVPQIELEDTSRDYLTIEELQKLAATEYELPKSLRRAALFSALTGLRFSDIQALTWNNVRAHSESDHFIEFRIRKTGDHLTLPISDEAVELMGTRGAGTDKVFAGLEYNPGMTNKIGRWAIAAGIGKPITFHCFRHTFATAQLTLGTDLYTVSKLLGHKNVTQTQVYARIIDEKKREAAGKIKLK